MSALLDVNDLLAECTGPGPATRLSSVPGIKPTVLVATPSRSVRNAIAVALQSVGYHCLGATDANTLADALGRSANVGLIILDARLPGFPVFSLCKAIRQGAVNPPAVLVLATRPGPLLRLRAKWAGACGVIRTPVRPDDVIRKVRARLAIAGA
jgi:DNA-binding response OmpR family regulator